MISLQFGFYFLWCDFFFRWKQRRQLIWMSCMNRKVKLRLKNMRDMWKVTVFFPLLRTVLSCWTKNAQTLCISMWYHQKWVWIFPAELQKKHEQEKTQLTETFQAAENVLKVKTSWSADLFIQFFTWTNVSCFSQQQRQTVNIFYASVFLLYFLTLCCN